MDVAAWQLVLVCWGEKYGADDINRMHRNAARHSSRHRRTVLITDQARGGLEQGIQQVDFPSEFLIEEFRGPGCQAKLAMFRQGIVPTDMPAIYTDLDSLILGDLAPVLEDHRDAATLSILQSTALPASHATRFLHRLSRGRVYARGNSSIVAFHPAHHHGIAERFLQIHAESGLSFKPTWADERFMSWAAQKNLGFVDRWKAVKFTREFMHRDLSKVRRRAQSPEIREKRRRLAFVTLNQDVLKPEALRALPEGAVIEDRKGRKTEWSENALAPLWETIRAELGT